MNIVYYVSMIGMNYVSIMGFGVIFSFMVQFFSGMLLSMYYNACSILCYESVLYIMEEVLYGYVVRGFHGLWAVLFMSMVYIHVYRGV